MKTVHTLITSNSSNMKSIESGSIDLIVTSPPYPMIEMWDDIFSEQNKKVRQYLDAGKGTEAFKNMHYVLNAVWDECDRVLKDNCFICINIGDATRTINGEFQLFPNHSEIVDYFFSKGYSVLPDIHWRKQSNAPNKFMGSGMYPAGAYVTYEHEYVLIFRKGGKRRFEGESRENRRKSAYFWEERNVWFSDLWDIKGTAQNLPVGNERSRNASFPLEIPYRLVNMYSVKGDTVLDPFNGLGTTSIACIASARNSFGIEISEEINKLAAENIRKNIPLVNRLIDRRINTHISFIDSLSDEKRRKCYRNINHGFDVKTKQETCITIDRLRDIKEEKGSFVCLYDEGENLSNANSVAEEILVFNID